jgi:phage shock protein PspC (stress-responsive transcriptional regulator)
MRTVITISLNGNAYQLDAGGFEAMRAYLQVAEQRLAGNPDQREILADLEQAIADKCRRYLGPHKNVVTAEEVAEVLKEMGPVDGDANEGATTGASGLGSTATGTSSVGGAGDATGGGWSVGGGASGTDAGFGASAPGSAGQNGTADSAGSTGAAWDPGSAGTGPGGGIGGTGSVGANSGAPGAGGGGAQGEAPRRLYQIREGAVISGVCKGLAAYLNIDVSIIRILFVALVILTGGVWVLIYIVMMFVIPYAQTSEQHAAAHGWPFNAEELVARAKAHYAQFRENGTKWHRRQYREQRRAWRTQHKVWKEQQRHWERWGGLNGPPPPPPPPPGWVAGQQPNSNPNPSYQAQLLNGVISPILAVVGVLVGFTFLFMLLSLIRHHTIFGWWWPHEIPMWVGIVFLVVLYRAITSPLHQARYAAYYGAPVGHAWVALIGALVWLVLLSFLAWEAWQHWDDVADFFQRIVIFWQDLIERRATSPEDAEHAALYALAWGVPSCVLPGYVAARELESHGQVDRADVLGEAADGDVVDAGFGDGAYGIQ